MVYRKNYRKGTRAASNKSISSRKPTAATQKKQILALNKKVNVVNSKIQEHTYHLQHKLQLSGSLVQPYIAQALIVPQNWDQVFGSSTQSGGAKYTGHRLKIDFHITPRTEHSRVDCTVIFASPKNSKVVSETGGATSVTCLPDLDIDYTLFAGMALLNKSRWVIHKVFRMTTLPVVTEALGFEHINSTRENRRYFSMPNPLRVNNRSPSETWKMIDDHEVSPLQRIHCYVFNNNASTLEGSPQFICNLLATGISTQ